MQHAIDIFFWSCMMQDWHLPCAFLLVSYVLCTLDTRGSLQYMHQNSTQYKVAGLSQH